jgi:uncharacterized membrane protein YdjX (TVP38/TMEM64 family)
MIASFISSGVIISFHLANLLTRDIWDKELKKSMKKINKIKEVKRFQFLE